MESGMFNILPISGALSSLLSLECRQWSYLFKPQLPWAHMVKSMAQTVEHRSPILTRWPGTTGQEQMKGETGPLRIHVTGRILTHLAPSNRALAFTAGGKHTGEK